VRFLVDAHLPRSLCYILDEAGYDSVHTSQLPLQNRTPDQVINELSFAEQRIVITKDTDFYYSHLLQGRPYKLLLIRTGNLRARELVMLIQRQLAAIVGALESHTLVEVDRLTVRGVRPEPEV
jgi:predicted nuclease of predicted toxin-antitoxin system